MAPNSDFFYRELAAYLSRRTGIATVAVSNIWWRDRERMLDKGLAQIGFLCGLQYVQRTAGNGGIELLAAPVMRSRRYCGEPIYFSDILVHRESRFRCFEDLRGSRWAYNEPTSHSGYNLIRYYLAIRGLNARYFRLIVESGSHQTSLEMLLNRQIDATAVDSTVLQLELRRRPELRRSIRVVKTLGPSPIPPAVILSSVPRKVRIGIQSMLLQMHNDAEGKEILGRLTVARFARVKDADYAPIRLMARKAECISFQPSLTLMAADGRPTPLRRFRSSETNAMSVQTTPNLKETASSNARLARAIGHLPPSKRLLFG
jgi:phosphonate transport system substrate-binding protein